MTPKSIPPLLRPAICALGAFLGVSLALVGNGRDLTIGKIALIGSFFLAAGGILTLVQFARKKEYGWTGTFIGVMALSMLVAVVAAVLKTSLGSV